MFIGFHSNITLLSVLVSLLFNYDHQNCQCSANMLLTTPSLVVIALTVTPTALLLALSGPESPGTTRVVLGSQAGIRQEGLPLLLQVFGQLPSGVLRLYYMGLGFRGLGFRVIWLILCTNLSRRQRVAGSKTDGPSGRSVANKAEGQLLFEVSPILPRGGIDEAFNSGPKQCKLPPGKNDLVGDCMFTVRITSTWKRSCLGATA